MSDMLRITGLATGIDTESMIQQMMKVEYMKVDRVKQQKQYIEWQMEAYRDVINLLRGFQDEYFNTVNPSSNLRSISAFDVYDAMAQVNGTDTNVVTVEATASAVSGTHTISSITSLAQKALWQSSTSVINGLTGDQDVDLAGLKQGKSFDITIDGIKKTITFEKDYSALDITTLAGDLQKAINGVFFGNESATEIEVTTGGDTGNKLVFKGDGHIIEISPTTNTYVSDLGFNNGQTNSIVGNELDFSGGAISLGGNIKIDVNGATTDVAINITDAADINDFVSQLQTNIDNAIGTGTIRVTNDGNKIKLISYNTSDEITVLSGETDDVLSDIGFSSGTKISKLVGTISIDTSDIGKEFDIYVDGTQYHIDLNDDYTDVTSLANAIDSQIAEITVTHDGNNLIFTGTNGKEIKIENSKETIVDDYLGFSLDNNSKNVVDIDKSLSYNFGITDVVNFEINGVEFSFDENDTVRDVINQVNSSSAGVTLSYSSLTDTFTLESDKEGFANSITSVNDIQGNLLTDRFKLQEVRAGSDAEFTLDGITTTRSSNTFTIDGVEYTLNSTYSDINPIEVTVSSNPDELIEKIKGFVEKYNEVISKINSKLIEERYYDYKPLTDAQKDEMTEKEIELWEEKAKSGILRSDRLLEGIVNDMRRALYDSVEGVGIRLYDIGITTSSNYEDRGKLVINETKLREALEERPQEIIELFTKDSDIDYFDTDNRSQRYNEEGLAERLYDILQDNIRMTRLDDGKKGRLLEKAGMEGDTTYFNNLLNEQLEDYNDRIDELMVELTEKEDNYYIMFAKMETAIQQMNAQMSWLMSQTGGGSMY